MHVKKTTGRSTSIRRKILVPMSIFVALQLILLLGSVLLSNLFGNLHDEAVKSLSTHVNNRKNYLQTEMLGRWANVSLTAQTLGKIYEDMTQEGVVSAQGIETNPQQYNAFLTAAAPELIAMLRANVVTGAFIVLNTQDLRIGEMQPKPGIYLRDRDPSSHYSAANGDLLLERAPIALVQQLGISTDTYWNPMFGFDGEAYPSFFYEPYTAALMYPAYDIEDLGYWGMPYNLPDDNWQVITYSVPLRTKSGTLYGVLGIDVSLHYLRKMMPHNELADNSRGAYVLAMDDADDMKTRFVIAAESGLAESGMGVKDTLALDSENTYKGIYKLQQRGADGVSCAVQYLALYNSNTPFSAQRWAMIGLVPDAKLFELFYRVAATLLLGAAFILLTGLVGARLITRNVSSKVIALAQEVHRAHPGIPIALARTQITEIDALAQAVETLNNEVIASAEKFTQIIEMASVKIGGFEVDQQARTLFMNEGFFRVFGMEDGLNAQDISIRMFKEKMHTFDCYLVSQNKQADGIDELLYEIPHAAGMLWVRLRYIKSGSRYTGLAEDVTRETLEMRKIAYERDHDALTGLWNRRAFHMHMKTLFTKEPQALKIAALLMLDLDNLKYINDTYGHDSGDAYIRCAANILHKSIPDSALVARMSGDEFFVFFYGYQTVEALQAHIDVLKHQVREAYITLPDGGAYKLRASCGIAWYPADSTDIDQLIRYADFAMYKVKNSVKGEFVNFDIAAYDKEAYLLQSQEAFNDLLDHQLVEYHFQPIVDARTGTVYAYEALMRSCVNELPTPDAILSMARAQSKLGKIEAMTWYKALETFSALSAQGKVDTTCRIFINSVPNQTLSKEEIAHLTQTYGALIERVVVELTEEVRINKEVQKAKAHTIATWRAKIALDDYGSGFNGESVLLEVAPDYVKIDISIVSGIDQDTDRQQMVQSLVQYAHARGILLVAEGVETSAELETLVKLGVDYLQGYYLARPAPIPPQPSEESLACIAAAQASLQENV